MIKVQTGITYCIKQNWSLNTKIYTFTATRSESNSYWDCAFYRAISTGAKCGALFKISFYLYLFITIQNVLVTWQSCLDLTIISKFAENYLRDFPDTPFPLGPIRHSPISNSAPTWKLLCSHARCSSNWGPAICNQNKLKRWELITDFGPSDIKIYNVPSHSDDGGQVLGCRKGNRQTDRK